MGTWEEEAGKAMVLALVVINKHQRALAHVVSGALRRSIGSETPVVTPGSVVGTTFAGGASAPYAAAIEYGTGIHSDAPDSSHKMIVIRPSHAQVRAFARSGSGPKSPLANTFARSGPRGNVSAKSVRKFTRGITHEGHPPASYMRRGMDESKDEVLVILAEAMKKVDK